MYHVIIPAHPTQQWLADKSERSAYSWGYINYAMSLTDHDNTLHTAWIPDTWLPAFL